MFFAYLFVATEAPRRCDVRPLVILFLLAVWLALPVVAAQAQCSGDSCQAGPIVKNAQATIVAGGRLAEGVVEGIGNVALRPVRAIQARRPVRGRLAKFIRSVGRRR